MRKFFANISRRIETRLACRRSEWVRFLGNIIQEHERQAVALRAELDAAGRKHAKQLAAAEHQREVERRAANESLDEGDEQVADLERQLASLASELADAKHALDLKTKELEVAEEQNETLWEIVERDRSRVQAERAAYQRATAEAESATGRAGVEVIDEE